ncbi:unnamed protein product [Pylaiella littoralis]
MYKGDERTKTMDIYVDGVMQTSWTSSGTTTDFENIELDVSGKAVELRGVLADSEWLSIMEVQILVDDGEDGGNDDTGGEEVEAGTLGTVTATAALYDTNPSTSNGCGDDGCTAALTRDGDESETSRWSCAPRLGGACIISYDLGVVRDLSELRLAMYKGNERQRTVQVSVDGGDVTEWTSSGDTLGFESIDLLGKSGQEITITGVLTDSEWLSITEVEILVDDGLGDVDPVPASNLVPVTVSTDLYDENLAVDGGCDPNGCTASNTQDGELADMSRWSCSPKLSDGSDATCSISYTFTAALELAELRLALYKGTERQVTVGVFVDDDLITTWTSSGTTDGFESIDLSGTSGTVVTIVGDLGYSEWLSIIETEIMALSVVGTPTPASSMPAPVTPVQPVMPTGDLQPVGLLPLPTTGGSDTYYIKDGDMSTSWTCTGDCSVFFSMFSYRHIKQLKIALSDDAGGPVDMTIRASFSSDAGEQTVTHTGSTDGFETFEFDHFTDGLFLSLSVADGSISIAEVEFVEEVQAGEISVTSFDTPYDNGDGLWIASTTDDFEWSSESEEALGRTLSFVLNSYAVIDTVDFQFPTGDTYKFDLQLYEGDGDPRYTLTGFESANVEGWQSFALAELVDDDSYVTEITIVIQGTGSGDPGFKLLNARFMGTAIDNPSDIFYVGSTRLDSWDSQRYPDFVGEGTGDQKAIMGAICAVKKTSFDGVDCVGGEETATGTVKMNFGDWFVDGNIFMKSGVVIDARFSIDDSPYITNVKLEEGAAGKTDIAAIVVMDGISNAKVESLFIDGLYTPRTSDVAVDGLGSVGVSIVGSKNITLQDTEVKYIDGDGVVVRESVMVNIDAGGYDEEYTPWDISEGRGTGLVVDTSDDVWIRRYTLFDNGLAGIHIAGSTNFTFEATIADQCYGSNCILEGEGGVGSVDGQQPVDILIEDSTDVKFQDMRVESVNDPVMTVTTSTGVSFTNCGFSNVDTDRCVIKTDAASVVTTDDDPELAFDDDRSCYVKV